MRALKAWHTALAGLAGIAAFGAGVFLRGSPETGASTSDEVVLPITRNGTSSVQQRALDPAVASIPSRLSPEVTFNPFGAINPGAPAALGQPKDAPATKPKKAVKQAVVAAPPPPPPTAPPLPFVAIGSLSGTDVTGGQPVAFVQQGDQLLLVRGGQQIGGNYRVESITTQRIEFTYLPLMQRQSLPLAP